MNKFKIGDRVRRINRPFNMMPIGYEGVVSWVSPTGSTIGFGDVMTWGADNFELVIEEPKPWLKITPPTPEKRELVSFSYGQSYAVSFSQDQTFAYIRWGAHWSPHTSTPQSFTKKELREFGETLIEISKEMK